MGDLYYYYQKAIGLIPRFSQNGLILATCYMYGVGTDGRSTVLFGIYQIQDDFIKLLKKVEITSKMTRDERISLFRSVTNFNITYYENV